MEDWKRRVGVGLLSTVLSGGWVLLSHRSGEADIYVRRDERGVIHFTNVPNRPGYRTLLRTKPARGRLRPRKDTTEFDGLIRAASRRHRVEFALVKAVIKAESAFDIRAVSPAGARGLMQLMPATAALHGVSNIYSPPQNIEGGVRHLRLLLNRYKGNLSLALAAYNAGAEAVQRYNGVPPYRETRQYIRRVLRYRKAYKEQLAANASRSG